MIPLGGNEFPSTREELVQAVTQGLGRYLSLPGGGQAVEVTGGNYPDFADVRISLTNARFEGQTLPPPPRGIGRIQPGVTAQQLELTGSPIFVRQSPVSVKLTASNARFDYDRDARNQPVLTLTDARNGNMSIEMQKSDLEKLVLAEARTAAAAQGVQVQDVAITLNSIDARSVSAEARVKAKKLFVTATIVVRGTLRISDDLVATVGGLSVSGEGMMGEMAAGAIRPKLAAAEGKTFPLSALSLGQVKLRDLTVNAEPTLRVTAAFGA